MLNDRSIKYFSQKELLVETYIVGYKYEGESIVILIKVDGSCIQSCIVDCYTYHGLFLTGNILHKNHIDKLDMICWTHPDQDHSTGMKQLIDEYAGADTEIWIAESANLNTDTVSDKAKILFKTLLSAVTTKNKAYHVFTASDNKNMMYYNPKTVIHNNTYYPIEMHALAPNSGQMLEQTLLNQYIANNKSIVFYLCVGEAVFLFTGDTDNHTIAEMPRNLFLQHLHVVKIPHHGSQTSDLLIEDLQGGCDVACSTVYRMGRSYLPDNLVMDKYRSISSELYCTGAKEKVVEKENYGVVHIQTDIFSREYTTTTFGNAAIW